MADSLAKRSMKLLLRQALIDAEAAHKQWESDNLTEGHSDPDWPSWYAQYLVDQHQLVVLEAPVATGVGAVLRQYRNNLLSLNASVERYEAAEGDSTVNVIKSKNRETLRALQQLIDLFAP